MPKFKVTRLERVEVYATIEADDANAAISLFDEHYPGLTNFAGNGGSNKLIGISPCDEVNYGVESVEDYLESQCKELKP
jgi:hypothetical protein